MKNYSITAFLLGAVLLGVGTFAFANAKTETFVDAEESLKIAKARYYHSEADLNEVKKDLAYQCARSVYPESQPCIALRALTKEVKVK